jgi:acyl-CoA thioesterase YciA
MIAYDTSFTVFPDHTNYNNPPSIFGGKMLAEMDNCAAMTCRRAMYGTQMTDAITVAVEKVSFMRPAFVGEIVHLHGTLIGVGTKSLTVSVVCERESHGGERVKMAQGAFVFVSRQNGVVTPHGLSM